MSLVREAVVAGTFYSDNPKVLAMEIERYLNKAKFAAIDGEVVGMVSPHAGYVYSGQVAAYGMKAVSKSTYDTVIVIGPSHRAYFEKAAVMTGGSYRTPLGAVDIDEDLATAIVKEGGSVSSNAEHHGQEHSLEVQIPFLQTVFGSFKLVPIVMGSQETDKCEALAGTIVRAVADQGKRVLIVGSTDLSHYYPYDHAIRLDKVIVDRLERFDARGLADDLDVELCEACGRGPMIVTMMAARALGATKSRVLKYANSGDVSGDKSGVVGYVSAVFFKAKEGGR
jgi:MEMO1 family protein